MPRGGGTKRTKSAPPQWPWNRLSLPGPGPGPSTQCSAARSSALDTEGAAGSGSHQGLVGHLLTCRHVGGESHSAISNPAISRWRLEF